MGVKIDFLKNPRSEYPEAIENYIILAVKRAFNPIGHIDFLFGLTNDAKSMKESLDIINKFNKKIIAERKVLYQQNKCNNESNLKNRNKNLAFLDLLLSYQETDNFTDEEIEEEVNTFMFGGQDTTSLTITYTLLAIGNHPNVQKRLQEEIDSIYQGDERPITSEDLSKMVYMDRVIKETLRVYYFVPFMSRTLVEDIEIDGFLIPKDVTVIISMHDLHHDPEIYPEPEKFDPDRFLPEVTAKRHPYAYIPFSAGPRSCIGQNFGLKNTKTILAYILRKFNITCLEKPEDIKKAYEIVLKPLSGLKVKLEKRHA
ncbi:cytochrome P450 4C1-like [Sitophilus oryzae]|uniref:Cytochrome P450 4C1-like n=1 Tax=Sitophilus oryzae TaxID=7048 RepID=A0A6J2X247_SITOR|nr:cytochrome P450 4C1-like [Sitophilus oryzae]